MTVTTQQLLQPDMGVRLPAEVRRALVEMGRACNEAAVFLHQATTISMQVESTREAQRAAERPIELALRVTADLQQLANQQFEQAIVVLARASTVYATYASQVAAAVATGQKPPLPGPGVILPSDLITAWGMYLPEIRFTADSENSSVVEDQNAAAARARRYLTEVITQLQGESAFAYDDIVAVTVQRDGGVGISRLVEFADALHLYASVLVWALSVFSDAQADTRR